MLIAANREKDDPGSLQILNASENGRPDHESRIKDPILGALNDFVVRADGRYRGELLFQICFRGLYLRQLPPEIEHQRVYRVAKVDGATTPTV